MAGKRNEAAAYVFGAERYHRQALLREVGEEGQRRLEEGHAVVIGCGALGSGVCELLVRAGVGRLTIVDRDVVELTNLQRQVLFDERDAREGLPKAVAAARRLEQINSHVRIEPVVADVRADNVEWILKTVRESGGGAGVLIDGTDNFEARYLLNDASVGWGVPLVYGGAVGTAGLTMTILPHGNDTVWSEEEATACLRCVFEQPPEPGSAAASATCDTVGVLGPVTAVIGAMQAAEAMKILMGRFEAVRRSLLRVDLWSGEIRQTCIDGARRGVGSASPCPCCALREFPFLQGEIGGQSAHLCGRDAVQVQPAAGSGGVVDLSECARRLGAHGTFSVNPYLMRGELCAEENETGDGAVELTVFADGRAIVGGVRDVARARSIYAKYVGG